jgi:hypothetical protein
LKIKAGKIFAEMTGEVFEFLTFFGGKHDEV